MGISSDAVNGKLKSIVDDFPESEIERSKKWRLPFIKKDLLNGATISNRTENKFTECIDLRDNNRIVLLLSKIQSSSFDMELYTYLLFCKIYNGDEANNIDKLHCQSDSDMYDKDGFPRRYFEYNGHDIGYRFDGDDEGYAIRSGGSIMRGVNGEINLYGEEEAVEVLNHTGAEALTQ